MSATDRVGIEIDLMGYEEAMKQMQNLDGMVKGLSGRKGYLKIKAELDKVEMNKRALKANKVKLQADMTDVEKDLKRVTNEFKQLQKSMKFRKGDLYNPSDYRNLFKLKKEMSDLGKQKLNIADELQRTNAEIQQSISYAERLRAALRNAGTAGKSLGQIFKGISSSVAHVGSAMQSMGNAISRFMTPLRMMGTGALLGAGYKAMGMVGEGLSSGFSRYDTMKKFPRIMKAMGYSSKQAEASVTKLDQAVQGLPTGLDEIVQMAQRYTLTLGDLDRGTNLAIAANNAFLASMSTDTQKYQGMMQLQDLMTGKKLRNTEWTSLINSMSAGINEVGKELGYADDEMDKFKRDLLANKIAPKEFLDALEKVGTGTGKLAKLANKSKDTWEAFTSRIGTAFSRMAYKALLAMDKIVKIATGGEFKSLNSFLDGMVIPTIDNLGKSLNQWIKSHPQEIINFFNDLKSIDWKGLGTGIVKGVGELVKGIQSIAKWFGGRSLEGVGKWIVRLNMIGQGLLVFGGVLKGLRHVIAGAGTLGVGIGRLLGGLGMVGASEKLLGFINFFKNFGKVGKAAEAAAGATGIAGGAFKAGSIFTRFLPALEGLAGIGAFLTGATGIAALDTKLLSMAIDNTIKITEGIGTALNNIKNVKNLDFDANALKTTVERMFQMWEIFTGQGKTVDAHAVRQGTGRSLAQMKPTVMKSMADSMVQMSSIIGSMTQIQLNLDGVKGFKEFDPEVMTGIANFAQSLGEIYGSFAEAFNADQWFGKGVDAKQAQDFSGIITATQTMFQSLGKVVNQIPKLVTNLGNVVGTQTGRGATPLSKLHNALVGEDGTHGFFHQLYEIFTSIQSKFQSIDTGTYAEKMGQIATAIQSIRKIGNQLSKLGSAGTLESGGVDTAISNIKSFISKLSTALDTTVVGDIQNKVGALRTTINGIFQALNTDLSNVKVTVNIKGEVKGADDLVSKINKAHTQITNAVRKIPSTITKTVTVNINGNVNNNLPNAVSSADVDGDYRGGYILPSGKAIYRKHGGGIPNFKPKGTDTVPAMLTPGEYVMKRSAVDTFGVRFMQRINNMDIRGAMRELSSRAGRIASVNRGTTNYITNNNNQQVTQHINTSNPNFAYKRSNRYVMAL